MNENKWKYIESQMNFVILIDLLSTTRIDWLSALVFSAHSSRKLFEWLSVNSRNGRQNFEKIFEHICVTYFFKQFSPKSAFFLFSQLSRFKKVEESAQFLILTYFRIYLSDS